VQAREEAERLRKKAMKKRAFDSAYDAGGIVDGAF
jgi:hypothetical protein